MRSTRIITAFIKNNNKILILKRSDKVRSMKGLWSGVSGIIENNEIPIIEFNKIVIKITVFILFNSSRSLIDSKDTDIDKDSNSRLKELKKLI